MNNSPMTGEGAAFAAWMRLRAAMRSWRVFGQQGLAAWMEHQGLGYDFRPGNYLDRTTQEFVLSMAEASHPGVEALQQVYQAITVHLSVHPERIGPDALSRPQREGRSGPRTRVQRPAQPLAGAVTAGSSQQPAQGPAAAPAAGGQQQSQTQQQEQLPVGQPTRTSWAQLDAVDLSAEARRRVQTLQEVPGFLKGPLREALGVSLRELKRAQASVPRQHQDEERAWKQFLLTPRMLLWRPP